LRDTGTCRKEIIRVSSSDAAVEGLVSGHSAARTRNAPFADGLPWVGADVFDLLPLPAAIVNEHGAVLAANSAWEQLVAAIGALGPLHPVTARRGSS
jgi:hypothetical protein